MRGSVPESRSYALIDSFFGMNRKGSITSVHWGRAELSHTWQNRTRLTHCDRPAENTIELHGDQLRPGLATRPLGARVSAPTKLSCVGDVVLRQTKLGMNRRFELREKTSQAHIALEGLIGPLDSLADYYRYLQGMHSFRIPLEAWLSRLTWPAGFGTWRPVMIAAALDSDLRDFDLQPRRGITAWDVRADLDSMLGALYVMEGSMLGAQLLLKRARHLGLSDDFGARHLALQAKTPANWQAFLTILEESSLSGIDDVASAANRAFGAAQSAFSR
jgi:heme oxygenase